MNLKCAHVTIVFFSLFNFPDALFLWQELIILQVTECKKSCFWTFMLITCSGNFKSFDAKHSKNLELQFIWV